MRAPSRQPDGGYRGSQPGSPAPPPLGRSPPPGFHFLPPHARRADPSPSAESRWGRTSSRKRPAPHRGASEGQGARQPGPGPRSPFGGALGVLALLDPPAAPRGRFPPPEHPPRRQRAWGSAEPPPPSTGAPKPSGTRKLRRELYPEKGFFFFFFFCKLPSLRRGVDILPRLL